MSSLHLESIVRHVRGLAGERTDPELLADFRDRGDSSAFAAIVRRHGELVFRVCRRVLHQPQDTEDAFQATFLILARKAASIGRGESLAAWLHGVARRVSLRAKRDAERRRLRESQAPTASPTDPAWLAAWQEVQALLDDEIQRLPAAYRAPFVLCVLEGQSRAEAARQLGLKEGTVWSRLSEARRLLRERLSRRGVTLSAVLAGVGIASGDATVSAALVGATVRAAAQFVSGSVVGVSPGAAACAEGAMTATAGMKLKLTALLLLACGLVTAGVGLAAHVTSDPPTPPSPPSRQAPQGKDQEPPRDQFGDALPQGARMRLGTERLRHGGLNGGVVTFAADGATLISAHGDGVIHVWEAATGKELRAVRTGYACFLPGPLAVSPGGKFVALPLGNALRVWNVTAGKELELTIDHALNDPACLAFSADGKLAATGGADGARLWDLKLDKELRRFEGHRAAVIAVAVSPDGGRVASKDRAGTVFVWGAGGEKPLHQFKGNADVPGDLCWTADGKTLAMGDGKTVALCDAATGKTLRRLEGPPASVHGIAVSADGKTVAAAAATALHFWNNADGKALHTIDMGESAVGSLAFSPDGKTLAATGTGCAIRLWDVETGKELHEREGNRGAIQSAAYSPDGRLIVTAGDDGTLRLWDAATGRQLGVCGGRRMMYRRVLFSADGRNLFAFAPNNPVQEWDAKTYKLRRQFEVQPDEPRRLNQVLTLALSPGADTLTAVGRSRSTRDEVLILVTWELEKAKQRVTTLGQVKGAAWPPELSPDGRLLASPDGASVRLHEAVSAGKLFALEGTGAPVVNVAFSRDNRFLAAVCEQRPTNGEEKQPKPLRTLVVWELATAKELFRADVGNPGARYGCPVAFSPDGHLLAIGGDDAGPTRLWDIVTRKELPPRDGTQEVVTSLAFSPDGLRLVTGLRNGSALVWDVPLVSGGVRDLSPAQLKECWSELAHESPARGIAAVWELSAAPEQTMKLVGEQLRPVAAVGAKELARLIADLDSDDFASREAASRELEKIIPQVEAALRKALDGQPSAEMRKRAEALLADAAFIRSPDTVRRLRAIHVLELIGSKEARRVLKELADGAPTAHETRAAKASLERLAR
jgi:RNA polymerase sigma factor (sigma-70 family)